MPPDERPDTPLCLVVDDNQLNIGIATHMLKRLGWRSDAAHSGEEALMKVALQHYDLVLLDLRMPHTSGEEICRRIREGLGNTDLPVVAYTAHGMPEERTRMMQSGFSGLLIKPISLENLRRACQEALSA